MVAGDPRRTETYLKADLTPGTCIIIEDNGKRSLKKILEAVRDAGGTLVYVLGVGVGAQATAKRLEEFHADFPDVVYLSMAELFGGPLLTEFSRSLTRARVLQYQRYFSDADRVLILLHNDPDPDAMASGLALRNVLHRTRTTAIIGAIQGVTRPENLRMLNLLDIHVEAVTPESVKEYSRVAMVDVQPHYFGGLIDRADLVIDHHPEQPGYTAVFKDIRADYGSTCTILTEHLRAVDINISERTATAMLYAIKSDTLFFNRQTNRVDIEAFSYLYPLADAALIRKMEGAEITSERLGYVVRAHQGGSLIDQVFCAYLGQTDARGLHPLRGGLLPADRERQVDRRRGPGQRDDHHLGAEPRVFEERGRVRAAFVFRRGQRRRSPLDGESPDPDARVRGQVRRARPGVGRSPAPRGHDAVPARGPDPAREEAGNGEVNVKRKTQNAKRKTERWGVLRFTFCVFRFRSDPIPARPHHRLDELVIRVLVAEADEFGQRLAAIGTVVVLA